MLQYSPLEDCYRHQVGQRFYDYVLLDAVDGTFPEFI